MFTDNEYNSKFFSELLSNENYEKLNEDNKILISKLK